MCIQCESEETKISKKIDEELRRDKIIARKEVKLLLLGTGIEVDWNI